MVRLLELNYYLLVWIVMLWLATAKFLTTGSWSRNYMISLIVAMSFFIFKSDERTLTWCMILISTFGSVDLTAERVNLWSGKSGLAFTYP